MDLYSLLPAIVRLRDSATIGSTSEGVIQRLIYTLEQDSDVVADEITGLLDLINSDECDPKYLLYISMMLGFAISDLSTSETPSLKFARWFVKNLVSFYKIKGTHLSWQKQWTYVDNESLMRAWELWKSNVYERGVYYRYGGGNYYGIFHAARVDLYRELAGIPEFLPVLEAFDFMETIDWCRPIHVLLRKNYWLVESEDIADKTISDPRTLGAGISFEEPLDDVNDEFNVEISCLTTCESVCEAGEETGCMSGCEISCEAAVEYAPIPGPAGPAGASGAAGADGCDACEDSVVTLYNGATPITQFSSNQPQCYTLGMRLCLDIPDMPWRGSGLVVDIIGNLINVGIACSAGDPTGFDVTVCIGSCPQDGAAGADGCDACEDNIVWGEAPGAPWCQVGTARHECWSVGEIVCLTIADLDFTGEGPISAIVEQPGGDWVLELDILIDGDETAVGKTATICHGPCTRGLGIVEIDWKTNYLTSDDKTFDPLKVPAGAYVFPSKVENGKLVMKCMCIPLTSAYNTCQDN